MEHVMPSGYIHILTFISVRTPNLYTVFSHSVIISFVFIFVYVAPVLELFCDAFICSRRVSFECSKDLLSHTRKFHVWSRKYALPTEAAHNKPYTLYSDATFSYPRLPCKSGLRGSKYYVWVCLNSCVSYLRIIFPSVACLTLPHFVTWSNINSTILGEGELI